MRRLIDQALILDAVATVRNELKVAAERNASSKDINEILLRLVNLYALLDVKGLMHLVEQADTREDYNERKVA